MKRAFLLILLAAAPAAAQDYRAACCEGRGPVDRWPGVVQARCEAALCPPEMMALIARQQLALTYASPSVRLQPYVSGGYVAAPAPARPMAAGRQGIGLK